jgi:hypothetical protein
VDGTISPIPLPWPEWTNAAIRLYHGTTLPNADSIIAIGIDVARGRATTDFGRGFYTTTDEENARAWSRRRSRDLDQPPALLRLTTDRLALANLASIVFIRGSHSAQDYWSFVTHCRSGLSHRPTTDDFYDVAFGPVSKVWFGSSNSAVWADYDQISFHTRAAQDMLNNKSISTLEVIP